jgi:3-oxoadipate enol-lactonase
MTLAEINGITIEYEERGSGPPLVLIYGYGGSRHQWREEFLQHLANDFRVITFDNRGTGGSTKPEEPWSMADFAADTVGLFEHLGLETTFLLGLSMGGMIAQETALRAPRRIEKLILSDTHCGAKTAVASPPWVAEAFAIDPELSAEQQARKSRPIVYSQRFMEEDEALLDDEFERLFPHRSPLATFARHAEAVKGWDAFERLPKILQPTLVIHGGEDVLVLPENGRVLAERIPNAELAIVEGSGHIPQTEQPEYTAGIVRGFLLGAEPQDAEA